MSPGGSVAPARQAARDHLRLNLCRALEAVEDARVAQDAADLIFQRIAVAAVDLQRRVGVRPGGARGEQPGHPGFYVAALARIHSARGEIGRASWRARVMPYV